MVQEIRCRENRRNLGRETGENHGLWPAIVVQRIRCRGNRRNLERSGSTLEIKDSVAFRHLRAGRAIRIRGNVYHCRFSLVSRLSVRQARRTQLVE